jgi:hypothetical protein
MGETAWTAVSAQPGSRESQEGGRRVGSGLGCTCTARKAVSIGMYRLQTCTLHFVVCVCVPCVPYVCVVWRESVHRWRCAACHMRHGRVGTRHTLNYLKL